MTGHQIICYTATNDIVAKLTREQLFGKMYRDMETAVLKVWLRFLMNLERKDICSF